jgi:DNA-binding PadR family transcriptional regulator
VKGVKRQFIGEETLKKLADAGDEGLTIYEASMAGPTRSKTLSTSTATKILEDFRVKGLVTRKEEGFRGAKPYTITPTGKDVLKVAKTVSDSNKEGKSMKIGELVKTFGEEKVNKAILACLLRYRVASIMEAEAVSCLTRIGFLEAISSAPLKKSALVIRQQ